MKEKLLHEAEIVRNNAYTPYSKFKVGASVLGKSGTIYTGCNIENASYSLTCCAERVAIFKGIASGENEFKELAVIGDTQHPIIPCGACLQVISEFLLPDAIVHLANLNKEVKSLKLNKLLPFSFDLKENS